MTAEDLLDSVEVHPAAELFPLIEGAEFNVLVADIQEHGQRDPVVFTPDGLLLDGRNRWRACRAAGIGPVTRTETSEPWAFVISTNLHRRHLNDSQRAMIGARIAERAPGYRKQPAQPYDAADQPPTQAEAAALLNVGQTSIVRARRVLSHGTPDLQQAVAAGAVAVATAERVARDLPPEQQDAFVQRVTNGADPSKLATTLGAIPEGHFAPRAPVAPADSDAPRRHQYVRTPALRSLSDSLSALELVLRNTDGLDPSITSEEAARWVDGLSKSRGAISRVMKLLNERKEAYL